MRVAQYYNNNDVRVEELPIPKIGEGEILMKIRAAGICGSDLMEWYRKDRVPRILGHEVSGEIAEIGPGVSKYKTGERIAASHHVPCYHCHYCRLGHHTLCDTLRSTNFDPGGFAEWVRLPKINCRFGIYKLPAHVSFEEATFIEPLACVVRGQRKAHVTKEQSIFIIGAGVSGLLHLMLIKTLGGPRVFISDKNDLRLELAKRLGADEVFRATDDIPRKIRSLNEDRLPDVVIVCAGEKPATLQSLDCIGRGGTILFFALHSTDQVIPLAMNDIFWQRGSTLMSTYAASPEDHRIALNLIASGEVQVKHLISHSLGLSEVGRGFELAAKAEGSVKVIINPTR